jgi:hypothetical protein
MNFIRNVSLYVNYCYKNGGYFGWQTTSLTWLIEDHAKVISTMLVEMLKRAKNGENYTHGNHFGWRKTSPNSFE